MTTKRREKDLHELRTKLHKGPLFQEAVKAYRRLAEQGCDTGVLMGYVGRVAGCKSGNIGRKGFSIPRGQQISREIRSIERQIRKLAGRVVELRGIWGFLGHMADAGAIHAPEELDNIADKLSCICTEGVGDWFPQREALLEALDLVRRKTGRAHYADVSLLINAEMVWLAAKNGREIPDMKFDSDSLKMIVRRDKQRQVDKARKQSEMKKGQTH